VFVYHIIDELKRFQKIAHDDVSPHLLASKQVVSIAACWVDSHQITSVKTPRGKATTVDTELFTIQLAIKATATGCKDIIIFTDNTQLPKEP